MATSKAKAKKAPATKKANGKTTSKTAKVLALLRRPQGCTREQALAATEWTALSFQQFAKSQHVTLQVDKKERPFHYRVA